MLLFSFVSKIKHLILSSSYLKQVMCELLLDYFNSVFTTLILTYDYDYDYEMVLLRHTISTMYHGIIFNSCKKHNILQ